MDGVPDGPARLNVDQARVIIAYSSMTGQAMARLRQASALSSSFMMSAGHPLCLAGISFLPLGIVALPMWLWMV